MKKKIIITFTICLFALGSMINVFLVRGDEGIDISMEDMSIMVRAESESPSTSNTGPKDSQQCGKTFCNTTEYFCRCENSNACTERLCSH